MTDELPKRARGRPPTPGHMDPHRYLIGYLIALTNPHREYQRAKARGGQLYAAAPELSEAFFADLLAHFCYRPDEFNKFLAEPANWKGGVKKALRGRNNLTRLEKSLGDKLSHKMHEVLDKRGGSDPFYVARFEYFATLSKAIFATYNSPALYWATADIIRDLCAEIGEEDFCFRHLLPVLKLRFEGAPAVVWDPGLLLPAGV